MNLTIEKCLQAWTNSFKQMNAKADIVFFGDSLTYYGDFSSVFPDKVVCNLGLRGDSIQGMIERVEQVKLLEPKVVYLMAGINDVAICTPSQFEVRYDLLIRSILEQTWNAELIVQSILPVNDVDYHISCNNEQIVLCNSIIKSLVNKYTLRYMDLSSHFLNGSVLYREITEDGIHLTSSGYYKWYCLLKDKH